jgi:hypothetical protein
MTKRTLRETVAAAVLALVVAAPALLVNVRAQSPQNGPAGFPDLVGGLKATPGVLGVETARTTSGKMVIFAWFENKKAVMTWYNSDMHQALVKRYSRAVRPGGPLTGVPDDVPVMAIASLTMPSPPAAGQDPATATTQIAIELYTPLPGGLATGGRFAPSSLKVPGLLEAPRQPKAAE